MDERLFNQPVAGWPVAILRIATGVFWLVQVSWQFSGISTWSDTVHQFLLASEKTGFSFYQGFLGVAAAHYQIFAWLFLIAELCIAIALTLGAVTRLAATLGLFLALNIWFAKGAAFWDPHNYDSLYIVILFTLMFTRCGRLLGLDFILSRNNPEWYFW